MRSYTNLKTDTTIVSGISAAATTITLAHHWWNYPESNFTVVLSDQDATPNQEVALIESRSGAVLTVASRGWDGTTAKAFDAGDAIECQVVAADFTRLGGFSGAKATQSTTTTLTNGGQTTVLFDSEDFDTDGYHDTTTNTSRMTVPEDGYYLAIGSVGMASVGTGWYTLELMIDGSGQGSTSRPHTTGTNDTEAEVSGVYFMTAGQYLEMRCYNATGGNEDSVVSRTMLSIYRVASMDGTSFSGASVYRDSTNQSISSATVTEIEWNAETFDTDSYHDNTTNNTRLTVPADGYYFLSGVVTFVSADIGSRQVRAHIDGVETQMLSFVDTESDGGSNWGYSFSSVFYMTSGQYLEVAVYQSTGAFEIRNGSRYSSVSLHRLHSSGAVKLDDLTDVDVTTTTPASGHVLQYDGSNWIPSTLEYQDGWTDWTPTVTQSGSVSVTIDYAKYLQIGNITFFKYSLDVTGTGTASNAIVIGGQPTALQTAHVGGVHDLVGTGTVADSGTQFYGCRLYAQAATDWRYVAWDDYQAVGVGPSLALASGDVLDGFGFVVTSGQAGLPAVFSGAELELTSNSADLTTVTWTDIDWDAAVYDTDSYWSATNPERIYFPAAGKYSVTVNCIWEGHATGERYIRLLRNDDQNLELAEVHQNAVPSVTPSRVVLACTVDAADGDYVVVEGYQNSGGGLYLIGDATADYEKTRVWIHRLHSSGAVKLDDLTDVDTTTTAPTGGELLKFDGSSWKPTGEGGFSGARAYRTTNQAITTGTSTGISFDTEKYDTDNYWEGVTNPDRFTIPEDGYYLIGGNVAWDADATNTRQARIVVDGTTIIAIQADEDVSASYNPHLSVSASYYLTAGQYVELQAYHNKGSDLNAVASGEFALNAWIYRVSSMDGTSFSGARVAKTDSTQAITTGTNNWQTVTFNSLTYDTDSYWDDTNDEFIAPADGYYLINGSVGWTGLSDGVQSSIQIAKNDTTGISWNAVVPGAASQWIGNTTTTVAYLSKDDSVELRVEQRTGSNKNINNAADTTYMEIFRLHSSGAVKLDDLTDVDVTTTVPTGGELLKFDGSNWKPTGEGGFSGARVKNSSTKTGFLTTGSWVDITWDSEDFDTDSYHDTSTNTDRLTIPADGYYLLNAHVEMSTASSVDAQVALQFEKNDTTSIGIGGGTTQTAGDNRFSTSTVAYLLADDYVKVLFYQAGGANEDLNTSSSAQIYRLSSMDGTSFSGAGVALTADQENITDVTWTAIDWDEATYDTDSYWSSSNASRLTVPADGYYQFVAHWSMKGFASSSDNFQAQFIVNNTTQHNIARRDNYQMTGTSTEQSHGTKTLFLSAGDYVEFEVWINGGSTVDIRSTNTLMQVHRLHSSGAVKIDDLTDVDTTTSLPAISEVLEWDGSNWTPGQRTGSYSLRELVEADAPISWLRLDETSGSTAADASGNSNTGTYVSSPTLGGVGVVGGSVDLDGTADYLTWDTIAGDLATLTTYTLEGWFRPDDYTSDTSTFGRVLFAVNDTSGGNRWFVRINAESTTNTPGVVTLEDGSNNSYSPIDALTSDEWHHIAAVYNGGLLVVYLNGVPVASLYHASNYAIVSTDKISIGQEWDTATPTDFFKGDVDEVAAYDYALSPAQIMAHFQAGSGQLVPAVRTSFSGAQAHATSNQTGIVTATLTPLDLDTEDFDTDSYWEGVTNPTRMTVPADGYYLLRASVRWDTNTTGSRHVGFEVDGSSSQYYGQDVRAASANVANDATTIIYLTSGQYVEAVVYQDSGGDRTTFYNSVATDTISFSIYRLHSSGAVKLDDLTDVDTTTTAPATGDILEYNGTDWVPATPSVKVKAADETLNTSTTLQDDNHLSVAVEASTNYAFTLVLFYNAPTTPDIKIGWSVPSGTTMVWHKETYSISTGQPYGLRDANLSESSVEPIAGQGAEESAIFHGSVFVSTTAGNVVLQWAQNTSDASDITMRKGSYLRLDRSG